jgi:superfamily II DNA helicase RecQ
VQTKRRKKAEGNISRKTVSGSDEHPVLYETIREWRLRKAKKRGIPAFRIFGNKVLDNLTLDLPTSMDELLMVNGVGPSFVKKHGKEILRMVREYQKSTKR